MTQETPLAEQHTIIANLRVFGNVLAGIVSSAIAPVKRLIGSSQLGPSNDPNPSNF